MGGVIPIFHKSRDFPLSITSNVTLKYSTTQVAIAGVVIIITHTGTHLHGSCSSILSADDVTIIPPQFLIGEESWTTEFVLK